MPEAAESVPDRSPYVDLIVEKTPSWPMRWTGRILVVAAAVVLYGAASVRYPEVIEAPIVVQTVVAPVAISGPSETRLGAVLVEDRAAIAAGDPLFVFASEAEYADIEALRAWCRRVGAGAPPRGLDVGAAQGAYLEAHRLSAAAGTARPASALAAESARRTLEANAALLGDLAEAVGVAEAQVALAEGEVERARMLAERGAGADTDLVATRVRLADRRAELIAARLAEQGGRARVAELRQQIAGDRRDDEDRRLSDEMAFRSAVNDLIVRLEVWVQDHVVRAPFDGVVTFLAPLSVGTPVRSAEPFAAITPPVEFVVGRIQLPPEQGGRISEGLRVMAEVGGYDERRVGVVVGAVEQVSLAPGASGYTVLVSFPSRLETTRGVEIPMRQGMAGSAEIVVAEQSLLGRLFPSLDR